MNRADVIRKATVKHASGNWIAGAIKHPGSFSKAAKKAGKSTAAFAQEHEHDSGTLGRRARLAQTLARLRKRK